MKNINYKIERNDVYIGEVVRADDIFRHVSDENFALVKSGQLDTSCREVYRNMLFVVDEENLSNDLLYTSPSYPILNITNDNVCLQLKGLTVIRRSYNLGSLLELYGYRKKLSYNDIVKIREEVFGKSFSRVFPLLLKISCDSQYSDMEKLCLPMLFYTSSEEKFIPHAEEGKIKRLIKK